MKRFTIHSIAIVVAIIVAGTMAVAAQTLMGGFDESTEYFDSKKHNKWHSSPNFKKALAILNDVREYEEIDYAAAIALLESEIKQHPANGYALCNLAVASINDDALKMSMLIVAFLNGDSGLSGDDAEKWFQKRSEETQGVNREALDVLKKGMALLPAADKGNLCKAYITCGDINKELEEVDNAIAAYEQAAATLPCYQSYNKLFKLYLEQGDNDKVLHYASKIGSMIDTDNEALLSLAKVYINNNENGKAEALISKAIANDETSKDAYLMLINMLIDQEKYQEAFDKTVEVSKYIQGEDLLANLIAIYYAGDDIKAMVINRLHELEAESPNSGNDDEQTTTDWDYFEGALHYADDDYRSALACFDRLLERKAAPSLLSLKAYCHYMLGDAPKAFKIYDYALRMPERSGAENSLSQILSDKIRCEMLCGLTDEQIYDAEVYCKAFPVVSQMGYEALTRGYFNKGQYAKALEICDEWIEKYSDAIEPIYMHAYVLMLWGKTEQAREELQDIINDENCADERKMFALFYMGDVEKSRLMLDDMAQSSEMAAAAAEPDDENAMQAEVMSFYNLACAYSLHGDIDRALHFLERHYAEEGLATDFDYAILDDELNNARKDPRFMEIVNRYKQQWLNGKIGFKK